VISTTRSAARRSTKIPNTAKIAPIMKPRARHAADKEPKFMIAEPKFMIAAKGGRRAGRTVV
jgi:hypothetical protein